MIYFYIGSISNYDRKILSDYVRTGDVEVIELHEKYERPYYAWHLISIQIGVMFIHYAIAKLPGVKTVRIDASRALVRHYKSIQHRVDGLNWHLIPQANGTLFTITKRPLEPKFAANLTKAIVKRVQNVYDTIPVKCDRIARYLWESRKFPDPCESMSPVF
ncbi:hypothetical protein CAEBREN_13030 [Caenorhabditis brenneri]|uniref:Glycosyltransferase family 92 protein n=1 Tax=Caenorhabditis brenneri TaxID=135651 RepID=G0M8Z1_CAEBE|nr:hypothetical protein CAEBREN_13030 [Caenorhabditis brenneri]